MADIENRIDLIERKINFILESQCIAMEALSDLTDYRYRRAVNDCIDSIKEIIDEEDS